MVYTYKEWTLYVMEPNFKNIGKRKMYFFSRRVPECGTPCDMPDGYEIILNNRTEMPLLKYSGNRISLNQRKKKMKSLSEKSNFLM
jgi:hypothetical protein